MNRPRYNYSSLTNGELERYCNYLKERNKCLKASLLKHQRALNIACYMLNRIYDGFSPKFNVSKKQWKKRCLKDA